MVKKPRFKTVEAKMKFVRSTKKGVSRSKKAKPKKTVKKTYYCPKCKKRHLKSSKIGRQHKK